MPILDPLAHFVSYLDTKRKEQRDLDDAELDRRIGMVHDLIHGPGANPARTAQGLQDIMDLGAAKGGRAPKDRSTAGFYGKQVLPDSQLLAGIIHGSIPMQGPTHARQTIQHLGFDNFTDPLDPSAIPGNYTPGPTEAGGDTNTANGPDGGGAWDPQPLNKAFSSPQYRGEIPKSLRDVVSANSDGSGQGMGTSNGPPMRPSEEGPSVYDSGPAAAPTSAYGDGRPVAQPSSTQLAPPPVNPAALAATQGFTGNSILQAPPAMVPPAPVTASPGGDRMLASARQMQTTEDTQLPMAQQPMFKSLNEQAEDKGNAEGIESTAKAKGARQGDLEALTEMFGRDEALKIVKQKARGGSGSDFQFDPTPTIFQDPVSGRKVAGSMVGDKATGNMKYVGTDGLEIPPNFVPVGGGATGQDPTSKKEYDAYVADEASRGNTKPLSYDNWLTMDANRKKPTTNINLPGTDLNSKQAPIFNQIVDHFQKSPLMKAKDRVPTLEAGIAAVRRDPGNGANQLALSYSYVQALDTYQSAVREGELKNLNAIDSRIGEFANSIQKMLHGQIERPEIAKKIADSAAMIVGAIKAASVAKEREFEAQAFVMGMDKEWNAFRTRATTPLPDAPDTGNGTPNPSGAKINDAKVAANGMKLYYDGHGWTDEPVLPAAPGAR